MHTRNWKAALAVSAMCTALLIATAPAGADNRADAAADDFTIVTLAGAAAAHDDSTKVNGRFDPAAQGYARALARLQRQHDRFVARLAAVAPAAEVVDHFFVTANAVVVKLNGSDVAAIGTIAGVERTQPSTLYRLDLNESVGLIDADAYWTLIGTRADAGAGVKVGVIDSGIDAAHEVFGCKQIQFGGIYYSGQGILPQVPAASALFGPGYTPGPGDPLYFSSEHGTHVAGTIGGCVTDVEFPFPASDTVTLSGVAPGVQLWDYNVFPLIGAGVVAFGGSAFSHDIGEAIEDAVLDGMDVINMSLSGGNNGPHDFLAEVSDRAAEAGVVVVAASGNDDPGLYQAGSPATGSEVIGVGATTNAHQLGAQVTTSGGNLYQAAVGSFPDFDGLSHPLEDWSGSDNQACTNDVAAGFHSGDIVLISRGTCSFSQKVQSAKAAGAFGAVIYNNVAGDPIPMGRTAGFDDLLPAVMVAMADGQALETEANGAPTTAVVTPRQLSPATPNLLADFSNIGPAAFTHIIKPDVVAPGENVLSSVFTLGDDLLPTDRAYELFNGTSMATPHVAGAAALLVGAGLDNREVKSALVTTASDLGYAVWEQGGGLIDVDAAAAAASFFYPSSASFGAFQGNAPANGTAEIAITGDACQTASVDGGDGFVSAAVSDDTLTVEFSGGRTAGTGFYSGAVTVTCGGATYDLPFLAVVNR
jgi:minor extracellular serine protease Vpr